MTKAIDLLARGESKQGYSSVDYGTLQIKHLGSIYEKLLEYKVKVAEESRNKIMEYMVIDSF